MTLKKTAAFALTMAVTLALALPVLAQGMMGGIRYGTTSATAPNMEGTAQDEAAGADLWSKLKAGSVKCADLKDDDFDVIGDYFMGIMAGGTSAHAAMNDAMTGRMGEDGEKLMHIAMGKRASGCDTSAAFPGGAGAGPWSMMAGSPVRGVGMMYGGVSATAAWPVPFHQMAFVTIALVWIALILSIFALFTWLMKQKK